MEEKDRLSKIRHSLAHLLAAAVLKLYPGTKRAIGPAIDNGFYYDFEFKNSLSEKELKKIEREMRKILPSWTSFEKSMLTATQAKENCPNNPYKHELIDEFTKEGEKVSFYQSGEYLDLCRGGHVKNPKEDIDQKAFKLTHLAGAYWRGDSNNTMLTRIYGVAFESEAKLKEYLSMMDRAEQFNHRKLGEEMGIYAHFEQVGRGLIVWLPKGNIIKQEIEKCAIELEDKAGYTRVTTPLLAKKELFIQSGHLPYYADSMYPPMKMDDGEYYLKGMNCPIHHLIFGHKIRSYRDLPLRIAEYGICHRNELSGTLNGLSRVRGMDMNDAHIYCTKDQMKDEIEGVLKLTQEYFKIFGLKDYWFRLSLGDIKNKEKFIDDPESWSHAETILKEILENSGIKYVSAKGEAAFYGPKIDVQFKNLYGKDDTLSTIQLDFLAKSRFNLHYDDNEGKQNNDVYVVHRAPLSTHERFMAFLIEHFSGKFPLWLNPIQVKILTVTDRSNDFAKVLFEKLQAVGVRVVLDDRSESIGKKVRTAVKDKANFIVTIGDKEVDNKKLAIRDQEGTVTFDIEVDSFIQKLVSDIGLRKC
jgi:threonyl-tRNA synthetase